MKVGVVADDLTGANATGVGLTKLGFTSATVVLHGQFPNNDEIDAVCIDTDSRYAPDETVVQRVNEAMKQFKAWGADVISKRIDSTVRGKIGLEIDTVLDAVGEESVAIVVAAFPSSGRVTAGGYLLVEGVPVQETDVAKDPVMPLTQSYIPTLIHEQSKYEVAHIGLNKVLSGIDVLKAYIDEKIEAGQRIIVVDAVTDENIDVIAQAMVKIKGAKLIPVDPGPMTAAYAKAYSHQLVEQSKIIVTVGSVTALSRIQLQYLMEKTKSRPVYVSAEKLATFTSSWDREVSRAVEEALQRIDEDNILIITTNTETNRVVDLKSLALEEETSHEALAKRITDGLGKITSQVLEKTTYPIQGCFTSGGDVTASLCAVNQASGIKLEDEVLPLIAYGTLIGGNFPGLPIVTKGGMVGDKRTIFSSVKYLQAKTNRGHKK